MYRFRGNVMLLWSTVLVGCPSPEEGACAEADKITVYADNDKDGFGAPETPKEVSLRSMRTVSLRGRFPAATSPNDDDCDDFAPRFNPGGIELCDGFDNDCDTESDEGLRSIVFFLDGDGDGFGNPSLDEAISSCGAPAGYVDNTLDCDDANAAIHPDATEVCDNDVDNDCSGFADDKDIQLDLSSANTFYHDIDGDSYGGTVESVVQCVSPGSDWVLNSEDCDDDQTLVNPSIPEDLQPHRRRLRPAHRRLGSRHHPATQLPWNADVDNDGLRRSQRDRARLLPALVLRRQHGRLQRRRAPAGPAGPLGAGRGRRGLERGPRA